MKFFVTDERIGNISKSMLDRLPIADQSSLVFRLLKHLPLREISIRGSLRLELRIVRRISKETRSLNRRPMTSLNVEFSAVLHCFGVGEGRSSLSKLALGLIERRLKRPRIDLEKELALLHRRTLLIALLQEVAGDLRPHVSIDQTVKRANPIPINRNILLLNLRHFDVRSAGRRTHSLFGGPKRSNNQSDDDQAKNSADQ